MIPLQDIKPMPCLAPGSVTVVVDSDPAAGETTVGAAPSENLAPLDGWAVQEGWTDDGGGVFSCDLESGYNGITSPIIELVDGALYLLRIRCVAKTSGTVSPFLGLSGGAQAGGNPLQWWGVETGSYSAWLHVRNSTGGAAQIHIRAENGFIGTIDQISLKLLSLP